MPAVLKINALFPLTLTAGLKMAFTQYCGRHGTFTMLSSDNNARFDATESELHDVVETRV